MQLTGSHIAYYHVCHRKLWLHHHEIRMEDNSQAVLEGLLLHETSYPQRAEKWRELAIERIKIDQYDPSEKLVREIKKTDKMEFAHIAQLKFYLRVLERNEITGIRGLLEYPKLRQTEKVELTDADRVEIERWEQEIETIVSSKTCPPVIDKPFCKQCAFCDFCYTDEAD